jgi:signal peptidase I
VNVNPIDYSSTPPPTQRTGSGCLSFVIDVLETLVLSLILFVVINAVSARIRVDGSSMEPTLHSGEFVIVNKLAYKFSTPALGDIIVFHFPRDPKQEYIKRVIGMPGDQVTIQTESFGQWTEIIRAAHLCRCPNKLAGADRAIVCAGDNRNNSSDSHNWGTVPLDYVVGRRSSSIGRWTRGERSDISPPARPHKQHRRIS